MRFYEWAKKWSIPPAAVEEWIQTLNLISFVAKDRNGLSETAVQNLVRLEATKKGCRLWRNNVGAVYTQDGNFMRYGLANETSGINKQIKSADLIGIKPVKILPHMVGYTIGQFVSREVKASKWKYMGTDREEAQLRWAELIYAMGGDACFAVGEGTF